jgi:hypothetical protein
MVASEQKEVLGIFDLECQEQTDGLERLLAAVDVIAEEEIVCLRWEATVFEKPEEIVVLPVNVA